MIASFFVGQIKCKNGKEIVLFFHEETNHYQNVTQSCFIGSYAGNNDDLCRFCGNGKTTMNLQTVSGEYCNKCLPNYKYTKLSDGTFKCTLCDIGKLASENMHHSNSE
ncbi:MAG: hypothetical protein MHPSP_002500, partial [Paramarteilia canceri]